MRALLFAACLCIFTTSLAHAQGALENPTPGSNQSGQGLISGWVCNASTIEIVVNGSIRVQAPYGSLRGDTRSQCGDVNNGFGFQVNWNELGDGTHSLVVLADGNQFAQATFTVKTLGVPVLTGVAGNFQLQGFAGKNVNIQWSEPLQNFVITGWTSSGGGPPPAGNFSGQWFFRSDLRQNTCTFLDPDDVPTHLETAWSVTQNGTSLTILSGSTTLTGDVQSNGEFTAVAPPLVDTGGGCTFALIPGYGGNFVAGSAIFAILGERVSGECFSLLPCQVVWGGTVTKTSALSTAPPIPSKSVNEILEDMKKAFQQYE